MPWSLFANPRGGQLRVRLALVLLLGATVACTGSPNADQTSEAFVIEAVTQAEEAWLADPTEAKLSALGLACERALTLPPSPAGDRALGAALSHSMMRPDLGVPVFARVTDWTAADADPWLDALLRNLDTAGLSAELERLHGIDFDGEHPTAASLAHQAARHRSIHWRDAVRAVRSAQLVEAGKAKGRATVQRSVPGVAAAVHALGLLAPEWELEVVVHRTTVPDDPDVATVAGAVPARGDRKRVAAYGLSSDPVPLRAALEAVDNAHPPRAVGMVVRATPRDGSTVLLCLDGSYKPDGLRIIGACDLVRSSAWLGAVDLLEVLRVRGDDPASASATVRAQFADALLRGE